MLHIQQCHDTTLVFAQIDLSYIYIYLHLNKSNVGILRTLIKKNLLHGKLRYEEVSDVYSPARRYLIQLQSRWQLPRYCLHFLQRNVRQSSGNCILHVNLVSMICLISGQSRGSLLDGLLEIEASTKGFPLLDLLRRESHYCLLSQCSRYISEL